MYIVSKYSMIVDDELCKKQSWSALRHYLSIHLEGLRKMAKEL